LIPEDEPLSPSRSFPLLDGIPGVVWEAYGQPDRAQQRINFVSPAVETMLGYTVQEWLDTPNFWLAIVHPEDRERAGRLAAEAFARGDTHTNQFRWVTKDGRAVWVESHSTVVRDASGAPIGMRGVTLDISARKETEQELRQNLEDLSRMQQVSTRLLRAGNVTDLLGDILAAAIEISGARTGNIQLRRGEVLNIVVQQGTASAGDAIHATPLVGRSGRRLGMVAMHYEEEAARPGQRVLRLLDLLARQAADLIENRQVEESVRASEAQLQRVIDETPFMLTRCSRDLHYVFVSRAYAEMLRRKPEEIEGKPIAAIMGDEGFATIRPFVERVLAGERVEFESEVPFAGVGRRALRIVYTPDRRVDDQVIGWIASIRDITEEHHAGRARALLGSLVETSYDAIVTKDLDGVVTSWNVAAQQLFGYTAEEMIGQPIRRLIPAERQSEEDDILARLRQGQRIEHFETVRLAKDGRRLNISVTISPLRDASGAVVGASKIARDISALKAAEAERLRLLQENAAMTEALNNVGTVVASDLDRDKVVQAVTDAATELTTAEFGAFFYNVLDERGESYLLYTISGVPREAFSKFPMPRNTAVFEPTFKGTSVIRSADITRDPRYGHNPPHHGMPRGHLPVRSYLAVPVKGRRGDVIGGLFFGHSHPDRFTEQHERLAIGVASWAAVALENARMFSTAQEASRLKDEFLATLSHELRTPLNAVLGYARMLRTGVLAGEKQVKAFETIERNATSLSQIVEDVLDISRIISGKIRLHVQPVDISLIVQNAIDVVLPAADAKGVRVESVLDPQVNPVSGDPERLQQILWNLLSNAVKFTNRGGKVQVRLSRVNSHVEVAVADTGIGIAREFLPHVFERFRQADASVARERGGLGLGLSIARQLAEMHGGTIDVASGGLGEGTTFRLTVPVMIVQPAAATEAERVHPRAPAATHTISRDDLTGVHVLAVDDDADAVALLAEMLQAAGARVSTAPSADDALRVVDAEVPTVIVTDIGMPRVDGFQLIDRIRHHRNPAVRRIPAAALTAYARSDDRVKALRAGFQIHLAKPIDPAELVSAVAALARFGAEA